MSGIGNERNGALTLNFKDMYPNLGVYDTSTQVQPDASDQKALVDNQEIAEKINTEATPNKFRILGAVGIIIGIAVIFSAFSK